MPNIYNAASGINQLDQLAEGSSLIHRLHPMAKLFTTFLYIIVVVSFPSKNISGLVVFLFYPAFLMPLSDTPYSPLLKRLLIVLPFSLMGGLSNIFLNRSTAFYIFNFTISYGMISFVSIMLKALFSTMAVLILIATTPFSDITFQLTTIHVPKIFCLSLTLVYRYISVLLNEALTMFTAYSLRASKQRAVKMKDIGSFLGMLVLRSLDRAERVYWAMKCRGFDFVYYGKKHEGLRLSDWLYIFLISISIIALRFFNLSMFWINIIS